MIEGGLAKVWTTPLAVLTRILFVFPLESKETVSVVAPEKEKLPPLNSSLVA